MAFNRLFHFFVSPETAAVPEATSTNTTLVLASVHGDEITTLYVALRLAHWLNENRAEIFASATPTRVILAPLVNPDGYHRFPRTRMNGRGVDINRNFPTRDWATRALSAWRTKYRSNPRRFPGHSPSSEPETVFQEEMIRKFRPQKILSIHSPLNFIDYDGPTQKSLSDFSREYTHVCQELRRILKAVSGTFFPGSLGNYAGRELGIPTLTLELPSTDPGKAELYWKKFSQGIQKMIQFTIPKEIPIRAEDSLRQVKQTPPLSGERASFQVAPPESRAEKGA